jgi:hypothetical protein
MAGQQNYIVKIGHIYLAGARLGGGYQFSSEREDAREYPLWQAEQIAGDLIAKGFALDPADVAIENVN